ncbi:MAG: lysylphosphatidylglycerol synthase domain-containing protein [Pseudomonadota bacterium]
MDTEKKDNEQRLVMSSYVKYLRLIVLSYIGRFWVALILVAGLAYAASAIVDLDLDFSKLEILSAPYLLAAVVLHILFWITLSYGWRQILGLHHHDRPSFSECFIQVSIVNIGKYMPGKVWGMLARGKYLNDKNFGLDNIVRSTYIEQLTFIHAAIILSALLFAALKPSPVSIAITLALLPSIYLFVRYQDSLLILLSRIAGKALGSQQFNTSSIVGYREYSVLLLIYGLIWLLSGMVFSCLSFAFLNMEGTLALVVLLVFVNTVSILSGFLAFFSPGGLGVREVVGASMLSTAMPLGDAVILVTLYRVWLIAADLIGGGIAVYASRPLSRTRQSQP